jgi:hypothetical protein
MWAVRSAARLSPNGLIRVAEKKSLRGFSKFLTFAPIFIKGSFTFYAQQKVSSNKSNAGDIRFSTGGS